MKVFIVSCVLLSVALAHQIPADQQTIFQDCLEKDSLSCVQTTVYRRAREFFDQPSIQFFGGISFERTNERTGKSLAPEIEQATSIQDREVALEDYLVNNVKNFFTERQLKLDMITAGRSIANVIPEEVKETVRGLVSEEGRTKKKILKKIGPFLGILKLVKFKIAALAVLAVGFIGLIAKKALFTSFLAIAIASASALSGLVAKLIAIGSGIGSGIGGGIGGKVGGGGFGGALSGLVGGSGGNGGYSNGNVEEIIAINSNGGSGGWSSPGSGWVNQDVYEHGAYSSPIAQKVAYSGQRPARR